MNLKMIRPRNEIEGLLLSISKNFEAPVKQTHRQAEETLESKKTKPREMFHFNPPISNEGDWMIGLKSLEMYTSIFNINAKSKFELYTDNFDEFSLEELKDEQEEILSISDITPFHLQHKKIGPRIIQAYRKLRLEKSSTDGYIILLMGYTRSFF